MKSKRTSDFMPLIDAIADWYRIPMGVYAWPMFVLSTSYKLYQERKVYEGEIGSSDFDDPFTQKEKIGKVSKGKEPPRGKERKRQESDRQQDYSEELEGYGERYIDKYQDFPTFYG
jgi:hypothetical protein